jgi:hypothetical protein
LVLAEQQTVNEWIKEQAESGRCLRLYLGSQAERTPGEGQAKALVAVLPHETVLLLPAWMRFTCLVGPRSAHSGARNQTDVLRCEIGSRHERYLVRVFVDHDLGLLRLALPEEPDAAHWIIWYEWSCDPETGISTYRQVTDAG